MLGIRKSFTNVAMEVKRLFFGMEIVAPWPDVLSPGRILLEEDRHMTIAFLGDCDLVKIEEMLVSFPKPPFGLGIAGIFDRPIFLPHRIPRVAAWHVHFLEQKEEFLQFQKELVSWLKELNIKEGEFLPHVTIARSPFKISEWKHSFKKLPMVLKDIHLCESLGYSKYKIRWSFPILAPFEEMEHTADIAFHIRGKTFAQLHLHAQLALSFHFPDFIGYFEEREVNSQEEIVQSLNASIARADAEQGCPFKAVSFHGEIQEGEFLEWEMIVDV